MARIRESTPANARVMGYGPAYIALLAQRTGVPLDYPASAADLDAQIRRGKADYVYLSHVHPRDSAHRLGDPLAPASYLQGRAEIAWWRPNAAGGVESALFKVAPGAPR